MAGNCEHQIVMVGRHRFHVGAEQAPEGRKLVHRLLVRAVGRRQDAPAVDEQLGKARIRAGIFCPRDRVRRNEIHALRQMRRHIAYDRAFDRADIGNDRARGEVRADLLRDAPQAPTGMQTITRSAPSTAAALVSTTWSAIPSSATRRRVCGERAVATIVCAAPCARAARAIDDPIRPTPISASRLNKVAGLLTRPSPGIP